MGCTTSLFNVSVTALINLFFCCNQSSNGCRFAARRHLPSLPLPRASTGLSRPLEQPSACGTQRPGHCPAAMDTGRADSPSPEGSSCWCVCAQMAPVVLQPHPSRPFPLPPLQQQPGSSSPSPRGSAWQAGGPCSAPLGTRWLGSKTHPRRRRPSCRCARLGSISVGRAKLHTPSLLRFQGQPRSRPPCKRSAAGPQEEALEGAGFREQRLSACVEGEACTASFQKEATGKSPVNGLGQSRPHRNLHAHAEVPRSPEQKCFWQFKRGWIRKLSRLESPFQTTGGKGCKALGTCAEAELETRRGKFSSDCHKAARDMDNCCSALPLTRPLLVTESGARRPRALVCSSNGPAPLTLRGLHVPQRLCTGGPGGQRAAQDQLLHPV